jgi:tetratricopeptide (TPR) repeat protein
MRKAAFVYLLALLLFLLMGCESYPRMGTKNLAYHYREVGLRYMAKREFENAEKYLILAVEQYEQTEPIQHGERAVALTALGAVYLEMDDGGEAVRQWLLAAEEYAAEEEPDWTERAKVYARIAALLGEMDLVQEAEKYYLKTEEQYRKAATTDHRALGGVYYRLSRLAKGYKQIMYALLAQGEYMRAGAQDAGLSAVSGTISAVYANAGVSAEGATVLARAVEALLGSDKAHPAILAEALRHLADSEAGRGELQKAANLYLSAIERYRQPEAADRTSDLTGLAQAFESLGNTYFNVSGRLGGEGDAKGEKDLLAKAVEAYAQAKRLFQSQNMNGRVAALQEKIEKISAHLTDASKSSE